LRIGEFGVMFNNDILAKDLWELEK